MLNAWASAKRWPMRLEAFIREDPRLNIFQNFEQEIPELFHGVNMDLLVR